MNKKNDIIIINGRHYDAGTGEALHHAAGPALEPATSSPAPIVAAAPAAARRQAAARQPAKHAAAHPPAPTRTLMRQAVKKPSASAKRRIKVQGHLGSPSTQIHSRLISRPGAGQAAAAKHVRHHAVAGNKGQLISHFSPHLFTNVEHTATEQPAPRNSAATRTGTLPVPIHRKPRTTAELLEYAMQQANGPQPQLPAQRRHRKLFKRHAGTAVAR